MSISMRVDIRRGLVQDEDTGIANNGASEAEQLPLANAQVHAALGEGVS